MTGKNEQMMTGIKDGNKRGCPPAKPQVGDETNNSLKQT
jgi:hypothetical protein